MSLWNCMTCAWTSRPITLTQLCPVLWLVLTRRRWQLSRSLPMAAVSGMALRALLPTGWDAKCLAGLKEHKLQFKVMAQQWFSLTNPTWWNVEVQTLDSFQRKFATELWRTLRNHISGRLIRRRLTSDNQSWCVSSRWTSVVFVLVWITQPLDVNKTLNLSTRHIRIILIWNKWKTTDLGWNNADKRDKIVLTGLKKHKNEGIR